MRAAIRLQTDFIDEGHELSNFKFLARKLNAGAVVSFMGLVRGKDNNTAIRSLTLEHYPGMTEKQMQAIAEEAVDRFDLQACLAIHRHGTLYPGEPIVFVATAAAHRQAAFDGANFLMDWLKTKAPFWKREETDAGTHWVDARESDDDAAKRWSYD